MFRTEGPSRSDRQNRIVAGYLAAVAGFVNSSRQTHVYGVLLLIEAALLAGFTELDRWIAPVHPRAQDAAAILLCAAMGVQNSLVMKPPGGGDRSLAAHATFAG